MFITLEGPEGAGKTTLQRSLAAHLRSLGHSVVETREPGALDVGQAIRRIILDSESLPARTELFLFLADRSNHVERLIRPSLDAGQVVICDRYADSTVVYQGYGRGFDLGELRAWNEFATGGLRPDLTLLLDLDPEIGLSRGVKGDRIDRESLDFHRRVREGFLAESKLDPGRWVILDATQSPEELLNLAKSATLAVLSP